MWELSTLRTYWSGLKKLYQVHWAWPHWTTTQALHAQITTELQNGSSLSVVRTILSAAAWAGMLGYLDEPIPAGMGKLPKAAAKRQTHAPRDWVSFAALTEMAEATNMPMEWCVVATAVLSTIMGLRKSEATTRKLPDHPHAACPQSLMSLKKQSHWGGEFIYVTTNRPPFYVQ